MNSDTITTTNRQRGKEVITSGKSGTPTPPGQVTGGGRRGQPHIQYFHYRRIGISARKGTQVVTKKGKATTTALLEKGQHAVTPRYVGGQYIRTLGAMGLISPTGGATIAAIHCPDGRLIVKCSICSIKDQFCRKDGRSEALKNSALHVFAPGTWSGDGDETPAKRIHNAVTRYVEENGLNKPDFPRLPA
jgi:hypothetical protein